MKTIIALLLCLVAAFAPGQHVDWKDPIDWRRTAWMNHLEDFAQTATFHHLNERGNFTPIFDHNPLLNGFVRKGNTWGIAAYFAATGYGLDRLICRLHGWKREAAYITWSAVEMAATLHNRKYVKFSIPVLILKFKS